MNIYDFRILYDILLAALHQKVGSPSFHDLANQRCSAMLCINSPHESVSTQDFRDGWLLESLG